MHEIRYVTNFGVQCLLYCDLFLSPGFFNIVDLEMRRRILFVSALLLSCLMALTACEEEAVNTAYDEDDIRERAYRALVSRLSLDTLDCTVMAVTYGDSLSEALFWPQRYEEHPAVLLQRLQDLPMRVVGIGALQKQPTSNDLPMWRTLDTDEAAVACFTGEVERVDGTHLLLRCGVYFKIRRQAYGVCDIVYSGGTWKVRAINFYYLAMTRYM